jgi:hypothetical protein
LRITESGDFDCRHQGHLAELRGINASFSRKDNALLINYDGADKTSCVHRLNKLTDLPF